MPVFILVALSVYLSGNVYVFIRGWQAVSGLPAGWRIAFCVVFWLLALSFFSFIKLRDGSLPDTLSHYLYQVGTGWLAFVLYMAACLLVVDLLKLFHIHYAYSFYVALALTCCALCYGYWHYRHPVVNRVDIAIGKRIDSPVKQLKVVALSDLHLGYGTDKAALAAYVRLINAQKADLILIAGDLVDNSVVPLQKQRMEEELSLLQAPLGIYMVPGNHEYISGIEPCVEFLRRTPVRLLQDSVATLPNGIQLVGRDDRSNRARRPLSSFAAAIDASRPVILLDHQPYELDESAAAGIDLQISGHTHHGQVWPATLLADRLFELSHGYLRKGDTHFYVSSGLSLWGPPFRIGSDSELVVFNLTFD
ncbi:MAG: metallophosphoesterase [Tannerellaceae bacterium]|nr:metallophosphoesterase [Tannerellaceae bacterium]